MAKNKLHSIVKESFKESIIEESSISRIWQHINNKDSFAIMSAFRKEFSHEENIKRDKQLEQDIKMLGLGYIPQKGGYTYMDKNGEEEIQEEFSFFIPKISKENALNLGKKYNQETIVFKDEQEFSLLNSINGAVELSFSRGTNSDITFDKETLKNAYSSFMKSKNKNNLKKYAFSLKEIQIPSMLKSLKNLKEQSGIARVEYIDLF